MYYNYILRHIMIVKYICTSWDKSAMLFLRVALRLCPQSSLTQWLRQISHITLNNSPNKFSFIRFWASTIVYTPSVNKGLDNEHSMHAGNVLLN